MKILIIDTEGGEGLDFALRCKVAGHQVRFFIRYNADGSRCEIGDGIVERVPHWEPHMNWADLIFLTDNTRYIYPLERYRDKGYPIFGPSLDTAKWEQDRVFGSKILVKAGINDIPSHQFNNYDDAIEFVLKHPTPWVSKPIGDGNKALSYVAKDAADLIFMLKYWKKKDSYKGEDFILQEFRPGIEMAVGGWFGASGFHKNFLENWEFKKLMNGDLGVATGEQGCYSEDTEVLTKTGWKYWPEVTKQDELATLKDGKLVYEFPSAVVCYSVETEMIAWKNRAIDILVTPNHNMYVQKQQNTRTKQNKYEFILAEDCTQSQYEILRTADWGGVSEQNFSIPSYTHNKGKGKVTLPEIKVNSISFARFLGLYIAEGSSDKQVNIAQSHLEKAKKAEKIIASIGFKYTKKDCGFVINSVQLSAYTKPLGRSWEKRVPSWIKHGSKEVICAFLEGYALGDGHTWERGYRCYYSCNRELLGDVQDMLVKTGNVGILKQRPERPGSYYQGRLIKSKRPQYELLERPNKTKSWLDKRDKYLVPYKGNVYCATVSSHILYVRRGGKPLWCGNTILRYTETSLLADTVLRPLEHYLHAHAYVGYIDVNCIITDDGQAWPLEFTMRPGWPLFQIQQALHIGDPAEWMLDLIEGRDTLKVSKDVACGVVISIPDYPYSYLTQKECSGYPLFGITEEDAVKNIHFSNVQWGSAPCMDGDKVKMDVPMYVTAGDYVLTVSGTGKTVEKAKDKTYKTLKEKIKIPNSIMYRTDIGCRLEEQLPKLHSLGYSKDLVYT